MNFIKPNLRYREEYGSFIGKYLEDDQNYYTALKEHFFNNKKDVNDLIRYQIKCASGQNLTKDDYEFYTLWVVQKDKIIGEGILRKNIPELIKKFAGHITYYILPEFRGEGLGLELLKSMYFLAKDKKYEEILICCDAKNKISKSIIEKSGACYYDSVDNRQKWDEITLRYKYFLNN